jgi:hypothetical protein
MICRNVCRFVIVCTATKCSTNLSYLQENHTMAVINVSVSIIIAMSSFAEIKVPPNSLLICVCYQPTSPELYKFTACKLSEILISKCLSRAKSGSMWGLSMKTVARGESGKISPLDLQIQFNHGRFKEWANIIINGTRVRNKVEVWQ